jgi:hypothetical protein
MSFSRLVTRVVSLLALCGSLWGVQPRPISHPIPAPPLSQVIYSSGYIFQGTVTELRWLKPRNPQDVATVQITFRVVQGIRGVQTGQMLSVKEWAGLWNSSSRYHVGENVVLFLYQPSKLGLTSPVAGPLGRFTVGSGGFIRFNQEQQKLLSSDPYLGARFRHRPNISSRDFTHTVRLSAEERSRP